MSDQDGTEALLRELAASFTRQYDAHQRYQDFRAVFLGSEQGKRVLYQILAWGHMYKSSFSKEALELAKREGERVMALNVLSVIQVEPRNLPERANSKPKGDA